MGLSTNCLAHQAIAISDQHHVFLATGVRAAAHANICRGCNSHRLQVGGEPQCSVIGFGPWFLPRHTSKHRHAPPSVLFCFCFTVSVLCTLCCTARHLVHSTSHWVGMSHWVMHTGCLPTRRQGQATMQPCRLHPHRPCRWGTLRQTPPQPSVAWCASLQASCAAKRRRSTGWWRRWACARSLAYCPTC